MYRVRYAIRSEGKRRTGKKGKNDRAGDVASSGRVGRVLERKARGASAFMSSAEDGPRVTRGAGGASVNGVGNVITFMSF